MASAAKQLRGLALATRTKVADRARSVRARARSINANLRRGGDDRLAEVKRVNGELAGIAERTTRQVDRVVRNARRGLRRRGEATRGRAEALVDHLERTAQRVRRIAAQTRQRLAGLVPDGSTRLVSLHDTDARPIAKGRLGRPVEFGYKAPTRRRQRRRDRRPPSRGGQTARRADAGPRHRTGHGPHRTAPSNRND
jgi:IS5 family transposase